MPADPQRTGVSEQAAAGRPSPLERAVDRVPFLEKELFLLARLVRRGDRCVDVGAAGGAHLLVMASRAGPNGRVLGVEPRPRSFAVLRRVVQLSGMGGRVVLAPVALSDTTGSVTLRVPVVPTRAHLPGTVNDTASAAAFAGLPAPEIEVPAHRLDDVVRAVRLDRVDVLKCDVEGAELLVLAGASRILRHDRPVVVLEADDLHQRRFDARAQDVGDAVVSYGYRMHRYRRGRLEPVAGVTDDEDDYVFVPKERPLPAGLHPRP